MLGCPPASVFELVILKNSISCPALAGTASTARSASDARSPMTARKPLGREGRAVKVCALIVIVSLLFIVWSTMVSALPGVLAVVLPGVLAHALALAPHKALPAGPAAVGRPA